MLETVKTEERRVMPGQGGTRRTVSVYSMVPAILLLVVSGSADATVKTWDAINGQLIRTREGIPGNGVAISRDGKLVVRGQDRPIVWETTTGVELPPFKNPVGTITSLACLILLK